jgi:hypothetical protein
MFLIIEFTFFFAEGPKIPLSRKPLVPSFMDNGSHAVFCLEVFFIALWQEHASECNEYCEEEIPADELRISESSSSPEMDLQSTQ